MRTSTLFLLLVLPLLAGCATTVGTADMAARLGPGAVVDETPTRATVTGDGHTIVVESGASLAFVDGRVVTLNQPTRLVDGRLRVSGDVLNHIPSPHDALDFPPGERVTPDERTVPTKRVAPSVRRHYKLKHVVIDPGHGGGQPGARYGGVEEKTVNLDIALQVAASLRRKGMRVTLTRTSDVTLSLQRRSDVANATGADVFVSIHADAAANRDARGIEVFHLASTFVHKRRRYNDASRAVEINRRREGARDLSPGGYLPPPVSASQLAKRRGESRVLARHIEKALVDRLNVPSRGLKTAGLAVLKWTAAPAVLVEVGFLSNAADRSRLRQSAYRTRVADAIVAGICAHREWYERTH